MVDAPDGGPAPRRPAAFVPILHGGVSSDFVGVCLVRNFGEAYGEIEPGLPVWILEMAFVDDARELHDWMLTRPERWSVWALMAPIVGPELLTLMMEGERDRDVRRAVELQDLSDALARKARTVTAASTEILGRPCVSLRIGSEDAPFLVIAFAQTVERDRMWDWVRWQTHRYRRWRAICVDKGYTALRNLMVGSMLRDERRARANGLAVGGPRPLRLWRGNGKDPRSGPDGTEGTSR
ncbi:hypothetical protein [Sphingomonas sp. PvP018]|uniref:hypothetical protein n=1 Tax=Sphingomonas sp. PvP018 TaxID=2817852 RepID=UPI001AEA0B05|nr:hypothetical protein [Sphingomonas sp. PvP018]MBP2513845.1 hypothetical protein [Sphingomonas sp. PvP018]